MAAIQSRRRRLSSPRSANGKPFCSVSMNRFLAFAQGRLCYPVKYNIIFKQSHLVLDSDELKQTMLILMPTLVEAYPLHSAERIYTVPEIVVRMYGLDNKADISNLFDESLQGIIHDISAGGIGVSITKQDLSNVRVGDLFQLCFVPVPNEEPLLLNARLRHVTDLNKQQHVLLGFQFAVQTLTEGSGNMLHRLNHIIKLYRTLAKKRQLNSS